jgi:hypothetical protein
MSSARASKNTFPEYEQFRTFESYPLMTYGAGNHAIKPPENRYIRHHDGSEKLYTRADHWNITNLNKHTASPRNLNKHPF